MDFKTVLDWIIRAFEKEGVRYGLIGGFALGALGLPRSTIDLDFLVNRDDLDKVDKIMRSKGYECVYRSENVSQYVSFLKIFGEIDFLYAFRKISTAMLERAGEIEIFEGKSKLKVLIPEDIIGLKVQSLANNPAREIQEYLDIEAIMDRYKNNLDWALLEEYFVLFGLKEKFQELKGRYYETKR